MAEFNNHNGDHGVTETRNAIADCLQLREDGDVNKTSDTKNVQVVAKPGRFICRYVKNCFLTFVMCLPASRCTWDDECETNVIGKIELINRLIPCNNLSK